MKQKKRRIYRPRPRSKWRGVKRNTEYLHAYEEALLMADFRAIQGDTERPLSIGFSDLQRQSPGRWHRLGSFKAMKRLKDQGSLSITTASRFSGKTYCIAEVRRAYDEKYRKAA